MFAAIRWMALVPVVGGGLVQLNKLLGVPLFVGAWLPDTLLGFETTGPRDICVGGCCRP